MIDGVILGFFTYLSMIFTFRHSPDVVKRRVHRHPFITDIIASLIAFFLLSGISKSIIAVVGAITSGLLVNITLVTARILRENKAR